MDSTSMSQTTKKKIPAVIIVFLLIVIAGAIGSYFFYFEHPDFNAPVSKNYFRTIVRVNYGDSLRAIASKLKGAGLIERDRYFLQLHKARGERNVLKSGVYIFDSAMSLSDIYDKLLKGESAKRVAIIEGYTVDDVANVLYQQHLIPSEKDFVNLCNDEDFIKTLGIVNLNSLEGYLYPDTYYFAPGLKQKYYISKMCSHFFGQMKDLFQDQFEKLYDISDQITQDVQAAQDKQSTQTKQLAKANEKQSSKNGKKRKRINVKKTVMIKDPPVDLSFNEVIILASLIEREARYIDDKKLVASVMINRLKKKYKLQCDATIRYALKKWNSPLTKSDLNLKSPFNTYLHFGLPPAPICSPSKSSISAVLNHPKTDYLYYCSMNNGRHCFSPSLKQHNNAVKKYRRISSSGRNMYR